MASLENTPGLQSPAGEGLAEEATRVQTRPRPEVSQPVWPRC